MQEYSYEDAKLRAKELEADLEDKEEYRRTHDPRGNALGTYYPNNRAGRRAIARSWRGRVPKDKR